METIYQKESIKRIVSKIKSRNISLIELAKVTIEAFKKNNNIYRAWVSFDEEILIKKAKNKQKMIESGMKIRSLEGIPFAVKDIFNTKDYPTQMGSPIWKDFTPGNDARVLYNLENNGSIIAGKTETAEFAVHALGNCKNPHDKRHTPGTSSSGSAVAVATGNVPFSIGTQTAGSIVRPASFCGVYACKPSFGLIPRTSMLKTTDTLDSIGFFAMFFEDLETIFDAIIVKGTNYPISHSALNDINRQNKRINKPWKVAFCPTHTWNKAESYARNDLEKWIKKIDSDKEIEVQKIELPNSIKNSHLVLQTIYDKTLAYYFKEESRQDKLISNVMKKIIRNGNKISLEQYKIALKEQSKMAHQMEKFFEEFDIIISLSTAGEGPLREKNEVDDPSLIWNMTYLPVLAVPNFHSPNGLPFGLQLVARRYNDKLLFNFGNYLLENNFIPPVSNNIKQ